MQLAGLPLRRVLAVAIGNALEFYDFLTFSFFAVQIGHSFFPGSQHGLLFTLATFGVGFLARPLGGVVIGRIGDHVGRRPAMLLSFALMGTGIVGLALAPPYSSIGIAAPILLVMFRLIQGFALGGEVGASTAFLVEAAPPTRRAFYVSLQAATQYVAVLAAGLVAFGLATLLSPAALDQWGWRAAFLAGVTIVPFGLALRRGLPETLHLPEAAASGRAATQLSPLVVGCSLLIIGSATIGGYGMDYMAVYAQDTLKLPPQIAFGCTIITGLVGVVASLAAGLLADRMGRKPIMLVSVALQIAMAVPAFLAMNATRSVSVLYTAVAVLGVVQNFADNASLVLITESLPKRMRSGALSVLYATSTAVFGGSAQFVIKALLDTTGNPIAPAFYMTAALFVGGAAMVMMRETRPAQQAALS